MNNKPFKLEKVDPTYKVLETIELDGRYVLSIDNKQYHITNNFLEKVSGEIEEPCPCDKIITEQDIKNTLKIILGSDAYNLGNMQVSHNVQVLAKAVDYLVSQLIFTTKINEEQEYKELIDMVLSSTYDILNKPKTKC